MALPSKITKEAHTALPELIRKEYSEKDGMFYLDVTPVDGLALEDVAGLKSTLSDQKSKYDAAAAKLAKFGTISPEQAAEAIAKLTDFDKLPEKEKIEARVKAAVEPLLEKHRGEIDELTKDRDGILSELTGHLAGANALAALSKFVKPDVAEVLLPHAQKYLRVTRGQDGKHRTQVVDDAGNPRLSLKKGAAATAQMDLEEFVATMSTDRRYASLFPAKGASGGGADGAASRNGSSTTGDASLPATERLKNAYA